MSQASTLIVEDQAVVAADLAAKVEALGYRVVGIVSTGERAIDIARPQAPDVALMDIRLAGPLDGIETAKRLQSVCKACTTPPSSLSPRIPTVIRSSGPA